MNTEKMELILALLHKILAGQENANEMLADINKRMRLMQQRLAELERQMGITYPRPPKRFVKGITDTWQSLN